MSIAAQQGAPPPVNIVGIETRWGYRSFELYQADITQLGVPVDVIVLSAFAGAYRPSHGTVIRSFRDHLGMNIQEMSERPWLDLRQSLGCWLSDELSCPACRRILGVELVGGAVDIVEALSNIFVVASVAEMKGVSTKVIALPVVGAGLQQLVPADVIAAILPKALEHLKRSPSTERILFVEINPERAALLNQAMNDTLDRVKVVLPKGPLISSIREEILRTIDQAPQSAESATPTLMTDLRRIIASADSRSYEIGVLARRLAEVVADDIVGTPGDIDLYAKIERTAQHGVAPWIRSYMHVLRVFGNESAHERDKADRHPENINESDLGLCLFCILRVLSFRREWRAS